MSYKIPSHADFLIAYSTIPGFYSWRNTTAGTKKLLTKKKNTSCLRNQCLLNWICKVSAEFNLKVG